MNHWVLYQEFPIKGFERAAEILDSAVFATTFDRLAGKGAREMLATRGVYRGELLYNSLLVLCKRANGLYNVSVFFKNKNEEAARKFAEKIELRL